MFKYIQKKFFAGLAILFPLVITAWIIKLLINFFDNIFNPIIIRLIHRTIPGSGLVFSLLLIFAFGLFATNFLGKRLVTLADKIIGSIPFVKSIYSPLRKVTDSITKLGKESFKKAVIIEYPRRGIYTIGFVTFENSSLQHDGVVTNFVSIFIPSTPNPTTGYLLFVPKKDIIDVDLSIDEAIQTIISGGLLTPYNLKARS